MGRNYDFAEIVKWFAERDLILLLFDAQRSTFPRLKTVTESLHQHDEKMRLVLNKADALTTEEIMRLRGHDVGSGCSRRRRSSGATCRRSGTSRCETRSSSGSCPRSASGCWPTCALPAGARTRKVNEFIKRVRKGRAHCLVFNPVWKSNFGRLTPSTRCCLRSCICSMAWQFHAIAHVFLATVSARWRGLTKVHTTSLRIT